MRMRQTELAHVNVCRLVGCGKKRDCNGKSTLCRMHNQRKYRGCANWDAVGWRRRGNSSGTPNHDGYIQIYWEGRKQLLSRLCWEAYYGPIPDGHEIYHKDEIRTHDRIWNLECLTKKEHEAIHHGKVSEGRQ